MGLASLLVREVFHIVREINRDGVTVLLVEQNAQLALEVAARAYVLANGRMLFAGPTASLVDDPRVREAYLG